MPLYHFTCDDHGFPAIMRSTLRPRIHPFMPALGPLLWLTDLSVPSTPEAIGLTSQYLKCDRLARRFEVVSTAAIPWTVLRDQAPPDAVKTLELFGNPEHWFIIRRPLTRSEWRYDQQWEIERRAL